MDKKEIVIVDGLFTWPSDYPRLIGSKCPKCGSVQFPRSTVCNNPDCDHSVPPEAYYLSTEGTLYTYTLHMYSLREPFAYHKAPYAVGAVELPEGIIVVGRLTPPDDKILKIGMKMKFKVDKVYEDNENIYLTYFFEPVMKNE